MEELTLREQGITFCPHCNEYMKITGFFKDDPELKCGHILRIGDQLKRDQNQATFEAGQKDYEAALKSFKGRTLYFGKMVRTDGVLTAFKNIDIFWAKLQG